MMTAAIRNAGGRFSTGRMVREYAERAYLPAHRTAVRLAADRGARAAELARWRERMEAAWPDVTVRSEIRANGSVAVGSELAVEVVAALGSLTIDDVRVEVVAGAPDGQGGIVPRRVVSGIHEGATGAEQRFLAVVPAEESGRLAVAARVVPRRPDGGTEPDFLIAWEDGEG
jgi:starch phosphorylase